MLSVDLGHLAARLGEVEDEKGRSVNAHHQPVVADKEGNKLVLIELEREDNRVFEKWIHHCIREGTVGNFMKTN